ncbi:MAG: addiction module protein [Proteobacteria bacterium]|nr:addiction module protein [Pseudomonadota bacterium]
MNARAQKILDEALQLPAEERAQICIALHESVEQEEASAEEVEAAWQDEIERRADQLQSGEAVLHDWADVERELRDLATR